MAHANQLFLVFCKISTLAEYSLIEQIYENLYMQKIMLICINVSMEY